MFWKIFPLLTNVYLQMILRNGKLKEIIHQYSVIRFCSSLCYVENLQNVEKFCLITLVSFKRGGLFDINHKFWLVLVILIHLLTWESTVH